MKLINKLNLFLTIILFASLSACSASVTVPTATLLPVSPTSTQPVLISTATSIPVTFAPSTITLPTAPTIPFITPNPIQVERWKEYENALAKALFPSSFIPDKFLCEWEILGTSDEEVYIYTECMSTFPVGSSGLPFWSTMPVVVHIEANGAVQSVEIPGGGSHYASDIRRMFPRYAQERYFGRLIHFQELTDHLQWRRERPEEPPLIVPSATPKP